MEATGISRGNMFHHFKNKEDIFNHAVDRFVFEFLTNDATDFLELTSSTPLKDFIDNRVENIGRRMKSFFIMTKGTVTPANFMSFILYLKDNYPDWKEKFQEYEKRKSLEWKEVIELAKHHIKADEIDYVIPHVSSMFFYEKLNDEIAARNIALTKEKWFTNLTSVGNIGSAAIYVALEELIRTKEIKRGNKILLLVPESGRFSYGTVLLSV